MAKVTFDGPNRLIIVNNTVSYLDVKTDLYSDWKEWMLLSDNSKFLPAFVATGGDPIGGGLYTGSTFLLVNGWKIRPYEGNHTLTIDGNLFGEAGAEIIVPTQGSFTVAVQYRNASLAQGITTSGSTGPTASEVASAVWAHASATDISLKISLISKILRNRTETNPANGVMTVYDDDNSSILFVANVYENVSGAQAYRGQGADRRDRLA